MGRSLEQLGDEIASLAADIQATMCRWLALVAEFDRREGWAAEGCGSCAQWVAWRCGIGPEAAREHVRVARRLTEMPLVNAAFAQAALTYSKVRALTRVEDVAREEELVELAREATAAQLERIVRGYRSVRRAEEEAVETFANRYLTVDHDEDGCVVLRGRFPAEQGAVLLAALDAARDELRDDVSAETPEGEQDERPAASSAGARAADALVHLAETALAAGQASSTGGDRYQLVVHVDAAALSSAQGGSSDARCEHESGAPLPHETARRLACDASIVRVIERDGRPLSVGRKTRSIPPALRRALRSRDRGCQFPGCTQHRHVDAHHLEHWAHGGATDLGNLVQLCRRHHRLIHDGAFGISGTPDALVFTTPGGRRLRPGPAARSRGIHPVARVSAETPPRPPLHRMDLGLAVDAVLTFAPPPGIEARRPEPERIPEAA